MKALQGCLQISRPIGGTSEEKEIMTVSVQCKKSCCQAIEIRASLSEFLKALTAQNVDCEFDFNDSGVVGKTCEHKEVQVFIKDCAYKDREKSAREDLEKICQENENLKGWTGSWRDATNFTHRTVNVGGIKNGVKGRIMRVGFHRFV